MMSCAIEMPVNKQTIYRWPLHRLCYQAVIPDPTHRCCFPEAAVPRGFTFHQDSSPPAPRTTEFQSSWSLCASSPPTPAPFPRYYHFHSLLFGKAGCGACHPLCVLCLCANSHPEELQSGTRALCLTAGMFCIYWHMGSDWVILTWKQFWQNKGLMQGEKNIQENRACAAYASAFTSSINIYCISYNWVSPVKT